MGSYARALGECRAEDFADLFVSGTGYFASAFRRHIVGRERLIALAQSEPHCIAPAAARAGRPGGANGPTVALEVTPAGVRGVASLGTAEYQDEYTKTASGYRFASRTVIIGPEKAAGIDARDMLAINELGGATLGDYYEADQNGARRLIASGVQITVAGTDVSGRAFLEDGSYDDQVYEKPGPGQWRVKSSVHVPAAARRPRGRRKRLANSRRSIPPSALTPPTRGAQRPTRAPSCRHVGGTSRCLRAWPRRSP